MGLCGPTLAASKLLVPAHWYVHTIIPAYYGQRRAERAALSECGQRQLLFSILGNPWTCRGLVLLTHSADKEKRTCNIRLTGQRQWQWAWDSNWCADSFFWPFSYTLRVVSGRTIATADAIASSNPIRILLKMWHAYIVMILWILANLIDRFPRLSKADETKSVEQLE